MTYEPTNIIVGEWGTLSIIIGGNDLTYYRGVPTQVANWSTAEPFSDRTAQLVFPSITSFDPLSSHPFKEEDDVEIWRTGASGVRTQLLWEGYVASISADLAGDSDQLTVECVGARRRQVLLKIGVGIAPEPPAACDRAKRAAAHCVDIS